VSGLVRNHAKAAALDRVRATLDAEMAKCDLLCSNCHHRHTHKYGAAEEDARVSCLGCQIKITRLTVGLYAGCLPRSDENVNSVGGAVLRAGPSQTSPRRRDSSRA